MARTGCKELSPPQERRPGKRPSRAAHAEVWSDDLASLRTRHDGNDFERHASSAPLEYPLLQQSQIVAFHELKAPAEVGFDPAVDVLESSRDRTSALANALV